MSVHSSYLLKQGQAGVWKKRYVSLTAGAMSLEIREDESGAVLSTMQFPSTPEVVVDPKDLKNPKPHSFTVTNGDIVMALAASKTEHVQAWVSALGGGAGAKMEVSAGIEGASGAMEIITRAKAFTEASIAKASVRAKDEYEGVLAKATAARDAATAIMATAGELLAASAALPADAKEAEGGVSVSELPDGSVVQRSDDGTVVVVMKDGSLVQINPDGIRLVEMSPPAGEGSADDDAAAAAAAAAPLPGGQKEGETAEGALRRRLEDYYTVHAQENLEKLDVLVARYRAVPPRPPPPHAVPP
jgi:hypothetical protein